MGSVGSSESSGSTGSSVVRCELICFRQPMDLFGNLGSRDPTRRASITLPAIEVDQPGLHGLHGRALQIPVEGRLDRQPPSRTSSPPNRSKRARRTSSVK